jgi:hypothetical protein
VIGGKPTRIVSLPAANAGTANGTVNGGSGQHALPLKAPSKAASAHQEVAVKTYVSLKYDYFTLDPSNRPVDSFHVERIKASMQANPHWLPLFPILVNDEGVVLDGQHRLVAAKSLGLPVYYRIESEVHHGPAITMQDVATINSTSRGWSGPSYLHSYAKQGLADYVFMQNFMREHRILFTSALELLGGGRRENNKFFSEGKFKVTDLDTANVVVAWIQDFEAFGAKFARQTAFIRALRVLSQNPKYDHANMLRKLGYLSRRLVRCGTTSEYLAMLEEIYNYKTQHRVRST